MNGLDDPDGWLPANQTAFRLYQVAKMFHCSTQHIYNLVIQGEIVVPQQKIEGALSKACILIPRDSLVAFLRRRSSEEWLRGRKRRATSNSQH